MASNTHATSYLNILQQSFGNRLVVFNGTQHLPNQLSGNAETLFGQYLAARRRDQASGEQPSYWIIGGDAWVEDLQASGLHNILKAQHNVNLLILVHDTEGTSKKDVGLYAMNYETSFVAGISASAFYQHAMNEFAAADKFEGTSLLVGFLPSSADGSDNEQESSLKAVEQAKKAVESGRWPLYSYNPTADQPLRIDSSVIKQKLQEFIDRSNTKSLLIAEAEKKKIATTVEAEMEQRLLKSMKELEGGLNGPPLLVLFGSDNGNAKKFADKVANGAKARGMTVRCMPCDDYPVSDLPTESHVLFVISTAGQGEFPMNSRQFWKALNASPPPLEGFNYGVFAMGDRHYWPRPEEKVYFAKSGKDLDAKLTQIGGTRLIELGIGDDQDVDGPETGYTVWEPKVWEALGVAHIQVDMSQIKTLTDDDNKVMSNYLRGTIGMTLADEEANCFSERDGKLLKFHGIYQQDDRDVREERLAQGLDKAFSFMIRVRVPGGVCTPEQWLAMDSLADSHANGTLKLTTRQAFQFHAVVKEKLKDTMQGINRACMDTLAACGDVNRNVMCSVTPNLTHIHKEVADFAAKLSEHLTPRTAAYHEIWMDKKQIAGDAVQEVEPLYGPSYLPRKFKAAIAVPPHNDPDVFCHCLGYIAIVENDKLVGFNVTVGGGMGMTHNMPKTYPRTADVMCFCTVEQAIKVGECVMTTQRDYGDRTNRKHARLKYTIDDRGIEWFRNEVQSRCGFELQDARPFKFTTNGDRYGWTPSVDGLWNFTLFVQGGRVRDTASVTMKTALREIAQVHKGDLRLTSNQNLVIASVKEQDKATIEQILAKHGVSFKHHSGLRLNSIACASMPLCGLAFAEAERYLPSLVTKIEDILDAAGLHDDDITIRMTGCPNGCARPYVAEIGLVGKAPGAYNLYLGGGFTGDRLSKLFRETLNERQILEVLSPILHQYSKEKQPGEHFGDFVIRVGIVNETKCGKEFHVGTGDLRDIEGGAQPQKEVVSEA